MIVTRQTPINEVRERGYRALLEKLGPVDYLRFLRDLGTGAGDYARNRHRWLDKLTIDDLDRLIAENRKRRPSRRIA